MMQIAVASDHAGFEYKEAIKQHLERAGYTVQDFGAYSNKAVDYPQFIRPAAAAVAAGRCERAIVLGGSGNGEAIVANRLKGIRCTIGWNLDSARLGRAHNDSNVLSIGQRMVSLDMALAMVDLWLTTPFDGGRHALRIAQIDA
jgi:ribose 5-phosphate isomerase B